MPIFLMVFYSARLGCEPQTHLHHSGDGITPCSVEIKEWNTATPTATLTVTVLLVNPW